MWKYLFTILLWGLLPGQGILGQNAAGEQTCLDCHKDIMANQVIHPPADEACDDCHEPTGNKHPDENLKGFTLADKVPGLCYMCHDEFQGKYTHPPVEDGECLTCHSPHSSPNPNLLLANPVAVLCFECHDQEIAENNIVHQPVSTGNCQDCHNPHKSNYRSFLKTGLPGLCFKCHERISKEMTDSHLHPPFEDDCRNCHQVHSSKEKYLLDQTVPALCFDCHDDVKESVDSLPVVHGAVKIKKACLNCHSPHASSQEYFLVKENKALCLSCHNKTIKTETKTIRNIKQILNKSKVVHGAIELAGCSGCHTPHASVIPFLLQEAFPTSVYTPAQPDSFALCFTCHDTGLLETKVTKSATNFRNGDQNLHYVHIHGNKGRSCKDCHAMHGSQYEHLIAGSVTFGSWKMPIKYQVTQNGGSCLTGCHARRAYKRN